MRVFLLIVIFIMPLLSNAGIPKEISPDEIEEMGVEVVAWHGSTSQEVEDFQKNSECTWVTAFVPLIDPEHPEYTKVTSRSVLRLNGKILTFPNVYVFKTDDEKRHEVSTCVPIGKLYEVDITYSYNPVNDELQPMCPPSYELKNIEQFLKN